MSVLVTTRLIEAFVLLSQIANLWRNRPRKTIEYYLKLSYWFVWYKEGLAYSLPEALDNLLIHYDKKKRGKRGSLQPKDHDIGYFYRCLNHCLTKLSKDEKPTQSKRREMTINQLIKWTDTDYHSVQSFLAGNTYEQNEDGTFTTSIKLNDWE